MLNFKDIFVLSLHGGLLEITLTVPLRISFLTIEQKLTRSDLMCRTRSAGLVT